MVFYVDGDQFVGDYKPTMVKHYLTCTCLDFPDEDFLAIASGRMGQIRNLVIGQYLQIRMSIDLSWPISTQGYDELWGYADRPATETFLLMKDPGNTNYYVPGRLIFRLLVASFQANLAQGMFYTKGPAGPTRSLLFDWDRDIGHIFKVDYWTPQFDTLPDVDPASILPPDS